MIKKLLRWARTTGQRDNSKQFAVQQVAYKGKVADCLMIFPYGVDANLPDDCLVALLAMEGNSENRAGIGWTPKDRLNLEEGENGIYHPPTGVFLKFDKNGNAELDLTNVTGKFTIKADVDIIGALTVNGKDFAAHTHAQGNDSGGNTEQDTGPVV